MKLSSRLMAAAAAVVLSAAAFGCENKKNTSAPSPEAETAASTAAETSTSETSSETTEASTASETTTEAASEAPAETTEAPKETTAQTTEPAPEEAPPKGFGSSYDAAKAYYSAYLSGNADAVYDMFCPEEISAYHAYIGTTDLLDGKNPQAAFKRSAVISAIKESISAIHGIMAEKSDVPPANWSVSLSEETLKATGENELSDFNKTLGTEFTSASDCGYVYYKDGNADHDFIGNGCAFVELDGRWYLSYSTVMKAELITYMDIFS